MRKILDKLVPRKKRALNFKQVVDEAVNQILDRDPHLTRYCSRNHVYSVIAQACRKSQKISRHNRGDQSL